MLGAAQLIMYAIYKVKSLAKKPIEKLEEEGSVHLVKAGVVIEMAGMEDEDEKKLTTRSLLKGRSLPMPSVDRQHSIHKILKTLSLSP